ncbi:MAG: serine hydrolase domain-containing protein [Parvularculaceae bacterium]
MSKRIVAGFAAAIVAVAGVAAENTAPRAAPRSIFEQDLALRSLVAGYKAAFTCSAYFIAGRSLDDIAGDELNRIYPDYRETFASLPDVMIDDAAKTVSVAYAEGAPARIAAWRPFFGCAQLPTGAGPAAADDLPRLADLDPPSAPKPLPKADETRAELEAALAAAFDRKTYGVGTETSAALVVVDGTIVAERYRRGFGPSTPQRTWSVAKSIAATVIGAAAEEGLIDVEAPADLEFWCSPMDPRAGVRVDDLLRMASGLTSTAAGNRTDDIYFGGGRVIDHAGGDRLVAPPGARWRYANNDTLLAMRALRERIGDDEAFWRFPFEAVLHPLGMTDTFLETDWNGDFVMSSQVWTTARDLALLGLLYLADGVHEGERILPEGWTDYVASDRGPQPLARRDGEVRPGYGAQFWLFDERHGLPAGAYAALGNRGQSLVIVPARNALIVRRGFDDNGGARFDVAAFASDALAALD